MPVLRVTEKRKNGSVGKNQRGKESGGRTACFAVSSLESCKRKLGSALLLPCSRD